MYYFTVESKGSKILGQFMSIVHIDTGEVIEQEFVPFGTNQSKLITEWVRKDAGRTPLYREYELPEMIQEVEKIHFQYRTNEVKYETAHYDHIIIEINSNRMFVINKITWKEQIVSNLDEAIEMTRKLIQKERMKALLRKA